MKTVAFVFVMIAATATADLDIWTEEQVISSVLIDSAADIHLLILCQYQGWGYSSSIAMLTSSILSLPDSFSIEEDVLVSHVDYSDTLEITGFMQILQGSSNIELDSASSHFPDTLVLICITCPFRAQPESLQCTWVLGDSLYRMAFP